MAGTMSENGDSPWVERTTFSAKGRARPSFGLSEAVPVTASLSEELAGANAVSVPVLNELMFFDLGV